MKFIRAFRAIAAGTRWNRSQLDHFQTACLRTLIKEAYRSVPFYRDLFGRLGLKPGDIQSAEDLYKIPAVARADLQVVEPEALQAAWSRHMRLNSHWTSGSSLRPLRVRRTPFEDRVLMALRLRVLMAYGARITDTRVSASMGDLQPQEHQPFTGRLGLFPRYVFDVRSTPEQVAQRLKELRPEIITGFPSSIQRVVECLSPADRAAIRPRFVTTASEMLFPQMRQQIAEQFQCAVYNLYGAAEANLIAWECPSTGYLHVMDHSLILQIETEGRAAAPGEEGEVVLTLLHSHAMPFIRCRLGDIAIAGPCPCPCGHGSATIAALRGRAVRLLTGEDGRQLNAIVVVDAVRAFVPDVRRFQIAQTAVNELTVRIVVAQPLTESVLLGAENAISASLDHRFHIHLHPVDEIADPTGRKLQYFVPFDHDAHNGKPD